MEDHVTVGAWATVQEDGGEHVYRVMPALEADPMRSWISEESPLGRALLGHAAGDVVSVKTRSSRRTVLVLAVQSGCA